MVALEPIYSSSLGEAVAPEILQQGLDSAPLGWALEMQPSWISIPPLGMELKGVYVPHKDRVRNTLQSALVLWCRLAWWFG